MFTSYLKIAFANLRNHKLYSAINVLGLAVGLACCLLISLFVRHELSYDGFFPNAERIYRLSPDFVAREAFDEWAGNVAPVAPLIAANNIDGVEQVARIGDMHALISKDDLTGWEEQFRWADAALFSIFQFDWLEGGPAGAFDKLDNVVISAAMARKYFGSDKALGSTLMLDNAWPLTVSGVFADLPANSHLSADFITTMDMAWKQLDFDYENSNNWAFTRFHTYLLLEPGAQIDSVVSEIESVVAARLADGTGERFGIEPGGLTFTPIKLEDIHLYSERAGEFKPPGSLTFVLTFSLIAVALLAIACINFMNLTTARASRRAKEVGLRKTVGASWRQLVVQFLCDSCLMTFLALVLAVVLAELLLPLFNAVVGKELAFGALATPGFVAFIAGITLLTALVAGSYPAFHLSALNPVKALRQQRAGKAGAFSIRNLLVIAQFSVSIVLLVATIVIALQMDFIRNRDLKFARDNVLVLWGTHFEGMGRQWDLFAQEVGRHPQVERVALGNMSPGSAGQRRMRLEGGNPQGLDMLAKQVGFGFFETFDIALIAGRDFDERVASDVFTPPVNVGIDGQPRGSYILNESAVRILGLTPEDVLGRNLEMDFSSDFSLTVPGPVIGVVEDVHLHSLREAIQPMAYFVPEMQWGGLPSFTIASVRLSGNDAAATVAWINEQWKTYMPEIPLVQHFLDSEFDVLYQDEQRQGRLFTFFAALTILIACLGLFGLASFAVETRVKEIGVRKVLGSSVWRIVLLLTQDFSKLVLIANVIAWPFAYVAMQRWLENFAYRIDLTPLIFIGSGLIALCIAWVTVGGTAAKAATQKPVLALRYE
ncbi:MAG: ABC transporter permease [Pseudomonadota bacterium]|nr:ABC transporter permease [Pseudomonadota bacterium]